MRRSEHNARNRVRATTVPRATVDTAITVSHLDLGVTGGDLILDDVSFTPVSYTHLTLPTIALLCRSRWSPYH